MVPGVEMVDINWLALAIAVVINIVLGFLWYSPKLPTGKIWMRGVGLSPDHKPTTKQLAVAMVLMVVGSFLMMFVFQHTNLAYRDAYGLDQANYKLTVVDGIMGAVFTWIAFFVPVLWGSVAWENKPWSLFFVNAGYYLVTLVIAGVVFASMLPAAASPGGG
ncbi:MAG: DUF1761 domain-containing protein [Euryarchaeota archaeon]|nr:DUF1761 domain-containing protein [Euryarchaeota archaeon]